MGLEQELGIDGPHVSEEKKVKILRLFYEIKKKVINSHEELLKIAKICLMTEQELLNYRVEIAEDGLELTPDELKKMRNVMRIVLRHS